MKIITTYHDYYDGVAKSYNDDGIIYNRDTKILSHDFKCDADIANIQNIYYRKTEGVKNFNGIFGRQLAFLGVAGKIYPVYQYKNGFNSIDNVGQFKSSPSDFSFNKQLQQNLKDTIYLNQLKHDEWNFGYDYRKNTNTKILEKRIERINNFVERNINSLTSIFIKYDTPTFLLFPLHYQNSMVDSANPIRNLVTNPCLKDFNFQSQVDAVQVYQQISMFLTNDLVKEKQPKIPVGTDVELAESKGFDKWSFRKKVR